jgi:superfamily II DNA helicase RecQ
MLEKEGQGMGKVIIYCPTVAAVDDVYDQLLAKLGKNAYVNQKKTFRNRMIMKFFAEVGEATKRHIMKKFTAPESKIRLVIATIAFGLGINIANIKYVIHWGIPQNHLSYWQEVGRAGRDGTQATAILYIVRSLFSRKQCPNFKSDMKSLVGIETDPSRATYRSKSTQTDACEGMEKLANTVANVSLYDGESSKSQCLRRVILRKLYIKGMAAADWVFEKAECTVSDCPLRRCCSLCKSRCHCQ